ncbi:MAG: branched-chain amino acid ABC transporter permease [Actinomycetota bacterium]|nr:branched-chain amino acid ABC transporter permease [Actinomycetota bacterium]
MAVPGEAVRVTLFLQYAANGIANGFVIGLLALSVVVIFRSTRVLSFAQGSIASLSTYAFFQMFTRWQWPVALAFVFAIAAAALIGIGAWALAMLPLRRTDPLTRTVATLALVLVLQMIMRTRWGGNEEFIKPLLDSRITIGSFVIGAQQVLIAVVAILATSGLTFWFRRSFAGLALSAMADDPSTARLLGVNPARVAATAWSIGAVLGALAGILITPLLVLNPFQMTLLMVTAFGAALLGGFDSVPLALGGALLIGIVQSVTTGYITTSGFSEAFGFIAVFAVLLLRRGHATSLLDSLARETAL